MYYKTTEVPHMSFIFCHVCRYTKCINKWCHTSSMSSPHVSDMWFLYCTKSCYSLLESQGVWNHLVEFLLLSIMIDDIHYYCSQIAQHDVCLQCYWVHCSTRWFLHEMHTRNAEMHTSTMISNNFIWSKRLPRMFSTSSSSQVSGMKVTQVSVSWKNCGNTAFFFFGLYFTLKWQFCDLRCLFWGI
jgi:hypothetical protein